MARLSERAEQQVTELIVHYFRLGRFEAADRLNEAVAAALLAVESARHRSRRYPSNYPALAAYGLSWFMRGRYWFSYTRREGEIVITSVFFDQADILRRFQP